MNKNKNEPPPVLRTQARVVSRRRKPLKVRLHAAGITYGDVARLARVSIRMVQFVVDGQRKSPTVMAAIARLAPVNGA